MSWERCPRLKSCRWCSNSITTKNEQEVSFDWSFIDQVTCICLKDRVDRFRDSSQEFHRMGLCTRVWYYRPDRPTLDEYSEWQRKHPGVRLSVGGYGCWRSHQAVNAQALENGCERILVLEDDALFLPTATPEAIGCLHADLETSREDWDYWYLGWFPFTGFPLQANFNVWRVRSVCTVAYISSLAGMRKLSKADPDQSVDFWMMNNSIQYASFPKLVWQRDSPSSVEEVWSRSASSPCSSSGSSAAGAWADTIKQRANDVYRWNVDVFDSLILIIVPLLIFALLLIFATYLIYSAAAKFGTKHTGFTDANVSNGSNVSVTVK